LHGMALVIHRFWKSLGLTMPKILAWFITFNFINIAWVFFRAQKWGDAVKVLEGMFMISVTNGATNKDTLLVILTELSMIFIIVLFTKSTSYYLTKKLTMKYMIASAILFAYAILKSLGSSSEVFLYYNF